MLILQFDLLSDRQHSICVEDASVECLRSLIYEKCRLREGSYFLKSGGKLVSDDKDLGSIVQAVPKLCGGKGGFGSMLRAIGAQIEKTTNREACRDLSGRRLRDINEEQRLKKWIAQQSDREREVEQKKKKKLEKLCREPKHEFKDEDYDAERADLTEKISDALEQGFKATTVDKGVKRKIEKEVTKKKKKIILDLEDDMSSTDDDESLPMASEPPTNKKHALLISDDESNSSADSTEKNHKESQILKKEKTPPDNKNLPTLTDDESSSSVDSAQKTFSARQA
ncbi:replication stress response regulator SDE2 [Cimex lectularius]|uniref:SDE2-like domain-containing protein n=1 Tax=Cimex lectularius TaxID=79782 RepID=A0A8I6SC88_CIMLE|nr:replication stress response regulator SDE2 [Cimex lectularius]